MIPYSESYLKELELESAINFAYKKSYAKGLVKGLCETKGLSKAEAEEISTRDI